MNDKWNVCFASFWIVSVAVLATACGGMQVRDSNKASYDAFHDAYRPHVALRDPDNMAVRVMAAMEPKPAAAILQEYLNNGQEELYGRLVCSVPRKHGGALLDALPEGVQARGVDVLGKDCGQDVLWYASRATYEAVAPDVGWLPAAAEPAKPGAAPDPTKGDGPAGWQRAAGRYVLQSIDGKPLPFAYPNGATFKIGITDFRPDGTFSYASIVNMAGSDTSMKMDGVWWIQGTRIAWATVGAQDNVGVLEGDTVTSSAGGTTYVSKREAK